jgi:hypothetical protein
MPNTEHHHRSAAIVLSNCTQCGAKMRLYGIEPHPTRDADIITYECTRCDGIQTEDMSRPL